MLTRFEQLFRSTNNNMPLTWHNVIKPIYICLSLFGLFPYSVRFVKTRETYKIISKSIYVNFLCGLFFLVVFCVFYVMHFDYLTVSSNSSNLSNSSLTRLNYIFELLTLWACLTVAYVSSFLNRKNYIDLLNRIIYVWNEIQTKSVYSNVLQSDRAHDVIRRNKLKALLIVFGCLAMITIGFLINFTRHDGFWKMILSALTFYVPQFIQGLVLAFYCTLVMITASFLQNIRERILKSSFDNQVDKTKGSQSSPLLEFLKELESYYVKVFDIKHDINRLFRSIIVVSTLQCFHSMVSVAHFVYHGILANSFTVHDTLNCSMWMIFQIVKIHTVTYFSDLVKTEALQIGCSLHNISIEKKDIQFFTNIQHFSALIKSHDSEFTAYGLFSLNAALILSIISSATMYLIIVIQFDNKHL